MENITITLSVEQLQNAVAKAVDTVLTSTYGNPVRDAVEKCIKAQDGPIQEFVSGVIKRTMEDPEFNKRMGEVVMQRMIESTLKK